MIDDHYLDSSLSAIPRRLVQEAFEAPLPCDFAHVLEGKGSWKVFFDHGNERAPSLIFGKHFLHFARSWPCTHVLSSILALHMCKLSLQEIDWMVFFMRRKYKLNCCIIRHPGSWTEYMDESGRAYYVKEMFTSFYMDLSPYIFFLWRDESVAKTRVETHRLW